MAIEWNEPVEIIVPKIDISIDEIVIILESEIIKAVSYAENRQVASEKDSREVTDDLALIAKLEKAIEKRRKEYVVPLNDAVKDINDFFKAFTQPLSVANKTLREKVVSFKVRMERLAKEAEEINNAKLDLARRESALNGEFTTDLTPVDVPFVAEHSRGSVGVSQLIDNWTFEITDFSLLPDDYKIPDRAMLKAVANKNHDKKEVPGIRFYNAPTLRVGQNR